MNLALVKNLIEKISDDWKLAIISMIAASLLSLMIFFETWASLVNLWSNSKTYTHGFIIAPISFWLTWTKRHQLKNLVPQIHWPAIIVIIGLGFLWLAANLIQVLVVEQYAVVAMLIASFWAILGTRLAVTLIFPLAFLLLMVPVGDTLIPPLMEYTVTFTVAMVRLSGLSVYREGMHFSLTSGNWSVIEACSGINYLIASITLGLVFAYVTYTSYWKRGLFLICSIIVPIIANGFRAYMIVMIGHLSGMKLAVGVDHILYGAVFFGLVIMILFYIGSFWKDPEPVTEAIIPNNEAAFASSKYLPFKTALPAIFLSLMVWPAASSLLSSQQKDTGLLTNFSSLEQQNWLPTAGPAWGWTPSFSGVASELSLYFQKNNHTVGLYQGNFGEETQGGSELVNSQHTLISSGDRKRRTWLIYKTSRSELVIENNPLIVDKSILRSHFRDLLVMRWYLIGDIPTANAYYAKILQLFKRLTGNNSPELQVIVYTDTTPGQYQVAESRLKNFAKAWLATAS